GGVRRAQSGRGARLDQRASGGAGVTHGDPPRGRGRDRHLSREGGCRVATRVVPKLRSREQGAAVPLTDSDRRLLNLLQSRFPLAERPFAVVAEEAGISEPELLERTQWLL